MTEISLTSLLRDPGSSFTLDTFYWQDDAACQHMPTSLWEVAIEGDEIVEGMKNWEVQQFNWDNLKRAQQICGTCPVRDSCATLVENNRDGYYMMFAGEWPMMAPQTEPQKPSFSASTTDAIRAQAEIQHRLDRSAAASRVCEFGHKGHWTGRAGKVFCIDCENEGLAPKSQPDYEWCSHGHMDWQPRTKNGVASRQCASCRRMKSYIKNNGDILA